VFLKTNSDLALICGEMASTSQLGLDQGDRFSLHLTTNSKICRDISQNTPIFRAPKTPSKLLNLINLYDCVNRWKGVETAVSLWMKICLKLHISGEPVKERLFTAA
jgi:hypothetical protein